MQRPDLPAPGGTTASLVCSTRVSHLPPLLQLHDQLSAIAAMGLTPADKDALGCATRLAQALQATEPANRCGSTREWGEGRGCELRIPTFFWKQTRSRKAATVAQSGARQGEVE